MKRVAIGGFFHESNTFNPIITDIEDFLIFRGEEIYAKSDAYLLAKGIIEFFRDKPEYSLSPLIFARAVPNGEVSGKLYRSLKAEFFAMLEQGEKPDIFVLALHGSMRVQHLGSAESDLLGSIRELYPDIPIVCGLDMHATITPRILECADALVGFKTAPHIDAYETGYKAGELADMILAHGAKLCMGTAHIPCLIAGEKSETDIPPMRDLIAELHKLEMEDGVCSASYLLGFPWADTAENGVTALVVTLNDQAKADAGARYLAEQFLLRQAEFSFSSPAYPPEEALRNALSDTSRPVFVSDSGDNPTAGSTADNTTVVSLLSGSLSELCRGKKILVAGIYDPIATAVCLENIGKPLSITIGGVYDTMYCRPVTLKGVPVRYVKDFGLYHSDLALFRTEEFDLILTSRHIGFTGTEMFKALDIDYLATDVIVVKLGYLTEDFKDIAEKSYLALSQGCTDEVLGRLSRAHQLKYI